MTTHGRSSNGARLETAASTCERSAAYSPPRWGVDTQRKCASPNDATSSYDVVNRRRPVSTCLRSIGSSPGSKKGVRPSLRVATLASSTSSPSTSKPSSAMQAAWVAPR